LQTWGGRSVGIVRSRTQTTQFSLYIFRVVLVLCSCWQYVQLAPGCSQSGHKLSWQVFCDFIEFLQTNARTTPRLKHYHFLPHYLWFTSQPYHPTLCSRDIENFVKYSTKK
jgi:hypothetical protein